MDSRQFFRVELLGDVAKSFSTELNTWLVEEIKDEGRLKEADWSVSLRHKMHTRIRYYIKSDFSNMT